MIQHFPDAHMPTVIGGLLNELSGINDIISLADPMFVEINPRKLDVFDFNIYQSITGACLSWSFDSCTRLEAKKSDTRNKPHLCPARKATKSHRL